MCVLVCVQCVHESARVSAHGVGGVVLSVTGGQAGPLSFALLVLRAVVLCEFWEVGSDILFFFGAHHFLCSLQ